MAPVSVNDQLAHAAINHAIDLQHYSTNVLRRMVALLNRLDPDIQKALELALEKLPPESFTVDRLEGLLGSVRDLNSRAFAAVNAAMAVELKDFTTYEADYQHQLFDATIPAQVTAHVPVSAVFVDQTYAAAMSRPFQGVLLRESLSGVSDARAKIIRDEIRKGYVANEPTPQIVRRIMGTKAKNYADGFIDKPRQQVESIVRTAVSHTAGVVRDTFYAANDDLIARLTWLSTIDGRTTLQYCVPRDLLQYTKDHKPVGHNFPWGAGPGRIHWCCRSTSTPVTRSFRDLGIDIDELSPSTRASMDGAIPAKTTYADWLAKQSAARQDEILGASRGAVYRSGGEKIDVFFNNKGQMLSLDEMKSRDARMFKKAA